MLEVLSWKNLIRNCDYFQSTQNRDKKRWKCQTRVF